MFKMFKMFKITNESLNAHLFLCWWFSFSIIVLFFHRWCQFVCGRLVVYLRETIRNGSQ